jgi:hypothetical protein
MLIPERDKPIDIPFCEKIMSHKDSVTPMFSPVYNYKCYYGETISRPVGDQGYKRHLDGFFNIYIYIYWFLIK